MGPVTELESARSAALRDFAGRLHPPWVPSSSRHASSFCRPGDAQSHSDIDVLVVVLSHAERRRLEHTVIDIAFDVNLAHTVYISARIVTPDILEHPVGRETQFVRTLKRESLPFMNAPAAALARYRLQRIRGG